MVALVFELSAKATRGACCVFTRHKRVYMSYAGRNNGRVVMRIRKVVWHVITFLFVPTYILCTFRVQSTFAQRSASTVQLFELDSRYPSLFKLVWVVCPGFVASRLKLKCGSALAWHYATEQHTTSKCLNLILKFK